MYGMSGPELLTQLRVQDTHRNAERMHQASAVLKERNAARRAIFAMNLTRFWRRAAVGAPSQKAAPAS